MSAKQKAVYSSSCAAFFLLGIGGLVSFPWMRDIQRDRWAGVSLSGMGLSGLISFRTSCNL